MNITIEVMLPPRGAIDFSQSAHPKWEVLAIVAVYLRKTTPVIGMQNTGYINVNNVPEPPGTSDEEKIMNLVAKLCAPHAEIVMGGPQPIVHRHARRLFKGDPGALPPALMQPLLVNRQINLTWGQCKALFRNRGNNQNLADGDIA